MLLKRKQIEQREKETLAPYASCSADSRGRAYLEKEDDFRTCFQRDRDRIIHSKAFRRLKGKTQVFVAHYGDHYRSRLAHSMEVAQLSRDIARALNLNEDLAEAIALAHDLGHTPFGHAGEEEMDRLLRPFGECFEHNRQSRRIVEEFEEKNPDYPGLNLTFEVREGLSKHNTSYDRPSPEDNLMPSIEAQIVNVADEIAYMNHDVDDGLRAKIFKPKDLENIFIWRQAKRKIRQDQHFDTWIIGMISSLISIMAADLANNTSRTICMRKIRNADDIGKKNVMAAGFSKQMQRSTNELKNFLFRKFYQSPGVARYNRKGKRIIRSLFRRLLARPQLLPVKFRNRLENERAPIVIKDYIAGMTDNFAIELYKKYC